MTALPALKDCTYTAFISYAHADDEAWLGWVTQFRNELERRLPVAATVRNLKLPPVHLSGDNGPLAGLLGEQLRARIAASFAMIVMVHDNYVLSEWCQRELELFTELFGEAGLRERLYIVAMSKGAIETVQRSETWRRLMPGGQQLWTPFYRPLERTKPLEIYIAREVVGSEFGERFLELRDDLAEKLKRSAGNAGPVIVEGALDAPASPAGRDAAGAGPGGVGPGPGGTPAMQSLFGGAGAAGPTPGPATADPASPVGAADRGSGDAAPAGAGPAAATGPATASTPVVVTPPVSLPRVLFGFVGPTAEAGVGLAAERLRGLGLPVARLQHDALVTDWAAFAGADRLVLAFDDAPPLMGDDLPGGHLQLQRKAWLRKGRAPETVLWLDLRPGTQPPPMAVGAYLASIGEAQRVETLETLAARLLPAAPAAGATAPGVGAGIRIYIESNRHERTLWESLGEQIERQWAALAREPGAGGMPPLALRARGLPVDEIDRYPSLDDADGVVLLWGRKTADALVAQINKVENKLTAGRDAAPGIVAYLMPPQQSSEPVPAWGWQVLRFHAADEDAIDVVEEERDDLEDFLRRVLARRRRREKKGMRP